MRILIIVLLIGTFSIFFLKEHFKKESYDEALNKAELVQTYKQGCEDTYFRAVTDYENWIAAHGVSPDTEQLIGEMKNSVGALTNRYLNKKER